MNVGKVMNLRLFPWIFITFYLIISTKCGKISDDDQPSTTLQLRDSVTFSYSVSNLFLDLIRGTRPPTALIEVFVNVQSGFFEFEKD